MLKLKLLLDTVLYFCMVFKMKFRTFRRQKVRVNLGCHVVQNVNIADILNAV